MIVRHDDRQAGGNPSQQTAGRCGWRYLASPLASFNLLPGAFDYQASSWKGKQPLHFSIEAFSLDTDASNQIGQALAFDSYDGFQANYRIVTRGQRADR